MIKKYWNKEDPKYDKTFDKISDNTWEAWKCEQHAKNQSCKIKDDFEKQFHCKPISLSTCEESWIGLEFENEGAYMLFMLEWS